MYKNCLKNDTPFNLNQHLIEMLKNNELKIL